MLLPIGRAEERARVTSIVVYALIIANVLAFLMELAGGDSFISGYAVVPWEITHGADLTLPVFMRGGGIIPQAPGPTPIYLTLITAMFMHSGWLHIGGFLTGLALSFFWRRKEDIETGDMDYYRSK